MTRALTWPILTLAGPIAALAIIWGPLFFHYHVQPIHMDKDILSATMQPVPIEIRSYLHQGPGGIPVSAPEGQAAKKAKRLMATGGLQLGSFQMQEIVLPFDPVNLEQGSISWRLQIAGLVGCEQRGGRIYL